MLSKKASLKPAPLGDQGFGMVQTMVAFALAGILSLLMMTLTNNNLKAQKGIEKNYNIANTTEDIRALLADKDACNLTFSGSGHNPTGVTGFDVTSIKDNAGNVQFTVGGVYERNSIKLTRINMASYDAPTSTSILTLTFVPNNETMGAQVIDRTIPISTTLTGTDVSACVTRSKMTDGIWRRVSATSWDIQFSDGKVGVGTSTPNAGLAVHSPTDQGSILISGLSDSGRTYSALYLGDTTQNPTGSSWVMGHLKQLGSNLEDGFVLGRWASGVQTNMLIFTRDGKMGLGPGANNPAYPVHVTGTGTTFRVDSDASIGGNLTVNTVTATSDRRLKEDIHPLENSLEKVLSTQGVDFLFKKDHGQATRRRYIGFVAQDLEKLFPELVVTDSKGIKSVDYGAMSAVLVEALKEMSAKNKILEERLEKLERQVQK